MTPDETVILARYVRALCPQQKFDEYTPDAWHDVLGDWPLATARTAAAAVAKQQPFVSPAEIIAEIRKQRDAKADSFQGPGLPAEVPDADPDDIPAYLAALRTQRTRAADGEQLKRRPVAELIAGVAGSFGRIPAEDADEEIAEVRRPGPSESNARRARPRWGGRAGRASPGTGRLASCAPRTPRGPASPWVARRSWSPRS